MKKIFSLFALLLACAAFSVSVISCKDDDDSPSTVATYVATQGEGNVTITMTLKIYDDNTFDLKMSAQGQSITYAKGTYEIIDGDATNGTIKATITREINESLKLEKLDDPETETVVIKNGKFTAFDDCVFEKQ